MNIQCVNVSIGAKKNTETLKLEWCVMQSLEPGADTWSVITYSAAGRAPSSNFWVGNSQFSCWQSLSPVYMYAHDTWKRRHTHTAAPCKLHFHQILLRCTFRCSGEGRGSWGNGWRLTEQVNEQEKSEKCVWGGCRSRQEPEIDISCLCKAWIGTLFQACSLPLSLLSL